MRAHRAARVLCNILWLIVGLMNEMNKHRPVCGRAEEDCRCRLAPRSFAPQAWHRSAWTGGDREGLGEDGSECELLA